MLLQQSLGRLQGRNFSSAGAGARCREARAQRVRSSSWRDQLEAEVDTGVSTSYAPSEYVSDVYVNSDKEGLYPSDERAKQRQWRSSWRATEAGGGRGDGSDYLTELGKSQMYNINVDHGQNVAFIDSLFTGNILGHKSDIADGSLRHYEFRTFDNIVGDYYVAPAFLEKVAMHMVKNYMVDMGCFSTRIKVPLILGIWGEKGTGKSFQTELAFKKMGVEAVVMSAGELEDEWAGTPGRLIRERYRKAADMSKVRGKMAALMINDIDAGLGHFDNVQVTVNNQIVIASLMNICDNPNQVSVGQSWRTDETIRRTPIIVTGNDFSKMFAPLIRDGRMEKFYWKPTREDLLYIIYQMYKDDGLALEDIDALLKRFHRQPLDFFGALRATTYDNQIKRWLTDHLKVADLAGGDEAALRTLTTSLARKKNLPVFEPVDLNLEMLIKEGERLEFEQQRVKDLNLARDYLRNLNSEKAREKMEGAIEKARGRKVKKPKKPLWGNVH